MFAEAAKTDVANGNKPATLLKSGIINEGEVREILLIKTSKDLLNIHFGDAFRRLLK